MMKQRNLVAKDMFDRRSPYKAKAVGAKKGKGSFQRKPKHKDSGY
jgi:stalled ribosome alternative rescue factor ArfA